MILDQAPGDALEPGKEIPAERWLWVAAGYVVLSLALALVSVTLTGFQYGVQNNIFHIPYVLRLSENREFSTDAFYGSLGNFTSIVWPLLRTICNESNVREVFWWANLLSRAGGFAGLLFLFRSLGLKSLPAMILCLAVAALSPWLQGLSLVGGHGMFLSYFTQSEVTWGFVFVSLGLLARNRLASSFAMTGVAFAINAFIGIWMLIANSLTVIAVRKSVRGREILASAVAFSVFAAPVAIWIATAVHGPDTAVRFSYIYYIRQYYPVHFLIEAATLPSLAKLALLFAAGLSAALLIPNSRFWLCLQLAWALLFFVGIPLPYLIDNRFVFNLHMLRSSGVEQAIAVVLIIAAGVLRVLRGGTSKRNLGLVILLCLAFTGESVAGLLVLLLALLIAVSDTPEAQTPGLRRWLLPIGRHARQLALLCIALFALELIRELAQQHFALARCAITAAVAAAFGVVWWPGAASPAKQWALGLGALGVACAIAAGSILWPGQYTYPLQFYSTDTNTSWLNFVDRIRSSDIQGVFLVPLADEFETFQLQARKMVWVGENQGAAVMWLPAFYNQWMPRLLAVRQLHGPEDFVAYARRNGIHNVVIKRDAGGCPAPATLRISSPPYLLCQL